MLIKFFNSEFLKFQTERIKKKNETRKLHNKNKSECERGEKRG